MEDHLIANLDLAPIRFELHRILHTDIIFEQVHPVLMSQNLKRQSGLVGGLCDSVRVISLRQELMKLNYKFRITLALELSFKNRTSVRDPLFEAILDLKSNKWKILSF